MVLMVFLRPRISPFTSTVIFRERSPRATAVVTSAMLRTWAVRLFAMALTESVRSFHVPPTPGTSAVHAKLAFRADFARDARDFRGEGTQLFDHGIDRFLELEDFATDVHGDLAREVATSHRDRHLDDIPHLRREVARPSNSHYPSGPSTYRRRRYDRLSAELAFGAHFARHARDFRRE